MKVQKKELKDRQFTPYEITVTIDNEKEHGILLNNIAKVVNIMNSKGIGGTIDDIFGVSFFSESALGSLLNEIKNHTK